MSGDRSGGGHRGTHEMGPASGPLPTFEVAIRSRRAAIARGKLVVVHAEAHRAARLAPFETGFGENAVEAFLLGLLLHRSRTGNDHRELDIGRDVAAFHD